VSLTRLFARVTDATDAGVADPQLADVPDIVKKFFERGLVLD
jgi:hypothetical protein